MELIEILTPRLQRGDDLQKYVAPFVQAGDIVAVSSKAIATVEGAHIDMQNIVVSDEARAWSVKTGQAPEFCQAIIEETKRLNGEIVRAVPHALMTRLRLEGMDGTLLVPNAGLDQSNVERGMCIGWPLDPVASARRLRKKLTERIANEELRMGSLANLHSSLAILITDSCLRPGRRGVTAIALATSGIAPVRSEKGTKDLFDKKLILTEEAIADQLATAANMLMGNAAQSVPFVIIRHHDLELSDWNGWVPGMRPEEDIFPNIG